MTWYEAEIPVPAGQQSLCASVVDGAAVRRIGCQTYIVPGGSPIGALDVAVPTGDGRVRVRGWALDPNSAQRLSVHIYSGSTYLGGGVADQRRNDIRDAYPAFGARRGFDFVVDAPTGDIRSICAYAIDVGVGNNTRLGCRNVDLRPNALTGEVTSVGQVPGGVLVTGWAVDPASDDEVRVTVSVDGTPVANRTAREPRVELEGLFASGENHGFSVVVPAGAGSHNICVDARPATGGSRRIDCEDTVVGGSPVGLVETVEERLDRVTIRGWAIDPDTASPVVLHVYVDGAFRTAVWADEPRNDLPFNIGTGGFTIPLAFEQAGLHDVRVFAIDRTGDPSVMVAKLPINTRSGTPFGRIQEVSRQGQTVTVRGWAIDPDSPAPAPVHVYVDGEYAGGGLANNVRNNIANRYPGYGPRHGFRFDLVLAPGNHQVCVYALDIAGGHRSALLECSQVNVP
ncbi:MAG: hypothetical protein HKN26_01750 [Acidimicrobiales bacterium]|nr:hypothetical protein [Acidimicrobiales bacterium]